MKIQPPKFIFHRTFGRKLESIFFFGFWKDRWICRPSLDIFLIFIGTKKTRTAIWSRVVLVARPDLWFEVHSWKKGWPVFLVNVVSIHINKYLRYIYPSRPIDYWTTKLSGGEPHFRYTMNYFWLLAHCICVYLCVFMCIHMYMYLYLCV